MSKTLAGGQKSEFVQGFALPFFYPTVKALEFNKKNVYWARILPSFELDSSFTPVGPLTYIPYRNPNDIDPETNKPMFTSWYYPLKGYKFLGTKKTAFLSPLTNEQTDKRGVDPLFDCYLTARNMPKDHEWHALVEKPDDKSEGFNAVIPRPRIFHAMNVLTELEKDKIENRIAVITESSQKDLKDKLNSRTPYGETPLDPNWPDYVLGDVTSPEYGLTCYVREEAFNDAGMKTMMFQFTTRTDSTAGAQRWPLDLNQPWAQEFMAKRYHIGDLENVTKVWSAEEILQFMVDDGFLPPELIEAACGNTWPIPKSQTGRKYVQNLSWDKAVAKGEAGQAAQPASQAPTGRTLAPMPGTSDRKFWMLLPGNQVSQQLIPESQIRAMIMIDGTDPTVCQSGENQWKPASHYGIISVQSAQAAPPPPVAAPASSVPPPRPAGPGPAGGPPSVPRPSVMQPPPRAAGPAVPSPMPPGGGGRPMPAQPAMPGMGQPVPPVQQQQQAAPPPPMAAPVGQTQAPPPPMGAPDSLHGSKADPVQQAPPPPAAGAGQTQVVNMGALSETEMADYQQIQAEFSEVSKSGKPMAPDRIKRYIDYSERLSKSRGNMT